MHSGILLLDKPAGITSHDLVARSRKVLGTRKVGHAGTLDPMATGLMILGFNAGTRLLHFMVGLDKQYEAVIQLGVATDTDDFEGEVIATSDCSELTDEGVDSAIGKLRGHISQIPSTFSAIKIAGKKAYELARAGEQVALQAREVVVSNFERRSDFIRESGKLTFSAVIDCSSGTYVRALARDLGNLLGVGGHLLALRRTRIGKFSLESSQELKDEMPQFISMSEAASFLMPILKIPMVVEVDIRHGKRVLLDSQIDQLAAVSEQNQLVAIMERSGQSFRSLAVFPEENQ